MGATSWEKILGKIEFYSQWLKPHSGQGKSFLIHNTAPKAVIDERSPAVVKS